MFERYSEKALKVIMLAQLEAVRLSHNWVGTELLLLGLIGEEKGIAAKALRSMGVNRRDARVEVEKIIGRGRGTLVVEIPYTPRAKKVLHCACEEADKLEREDVDTEHLLLSLISDANESLSEESQGVAFRVLRILKVDLDVLRTKAFELIESEI